MSAKVNAINMEISSKSAEYELSETDIAVVKERAISGEIEAFSELSYMYLNQVYRYIFYQVKDKQNAEDLVTEIFLETYKKISTHKKNMDYSIWQYQVACNYMSEDPRFVSTLPFLEKQIILLKFILDLGDRDISIITRTSASKIKMIQAFALCHLAGEIQADCPKPDKYLANILDNCLKRISTGESVERCLYKYDKQRVYLEPLLKIALNISEVVKVSVGDDFKRNFKNNLVYKLKQIIVRMAEIKHGNLPRQFEMGARPIPESRVFPAPVPDKIDALFKKSPISEPADESLDGRLTTESGDSDIAGKVPQKILQLFRDSKVIAISGAIILLVILLAALILSGAPGKISSLLTPSLAGVLNISSGTAEVQTSAASGWQKATSGMKLKPGMSVQTDSSSQADIKLEDGSEVYLDASTDIEINQADFKSGGPNTVILKQNSGTTTCEVVKLPTPDSQFEIQTPSAVVSVKGTHFITSVDSKGNTHVTVENGVVAVSAQGQEVSVKAGYQTTVEKGQAPEQPVPVENNTAPSATPVHTVVAEPKYTLTIKNAGGGTVSQPATASASYDAGIKVDLLATPAQGYAFAGWSGDIGNIDDPKSAGTTITMDGNYVVNANFAKMYTLTIRTTGGSILQPGELTQDYSDGSIVKLSAKPDDGYQFVNWTGDIANIADPDSSETTITVKADTTITANFVQVYSLTINSANGGWVLKPALGTHTYSAGTSVDIQAVPDNGYIFAGWNCDSNILADPTAASTQVLMVKDVVLTPKFTKTQKLYSLTVSAGNGGRIEQPSGQSVYSSPEGTVIDLTAIPDSGYSFYNWTGNTANVANIYSAITSVIMKSDTALIANFVPSYTLTVDSSTGGTVTPASGVVYTYNSGTIVNISATPAAGYAFRGWTGDLEDVDNPQSPDTFLTLQDNTEITAVFTPIEYSLTVNVSGNGTVSGMESGFYHYGDVVQLTATPAPGWSFSTWGGDLTGGTNPVSIIMNDDKKITVTFVQKNQ